MPKKPKEKKRFTARIEIKVEVEFDEGIPVGQVLDEITEGCDYKLKYKDSRMEVIETELVDSRITHCPEVLP